jgi:hypothetical protein
MTLENAAAGPANPTSKRAGDLPPEIPRDRWGRPKILLPEDEATGFGQTTLKAYTRASTLGGVLEDQTGLGEWKKRVVAYGMGRRRDLVIAAASVRSLDEKNQLTSIAEQAMQAAEASAAATIGTALHALADRLDQGEPIPDIGEDRYALDAYAQLRSHFTVHAIEQFVVCDELEVAGTADRVLSPTGVMVAPDGTRITPEDRLIDDLKTAATADYFGIKFCVQLAVYAHGLPYQHGKGRLPWPDGIAPRTDWGLIMHVPSGGSTADLYWVDLKLGWELAQLAVQVREWRRRKDLVVPAALPQPGWVDAPAEPAHAVGLAKLIADEPPGPDLRDRLVELYRRHKHEWTDQHNQLVKARLNGGG